MQSGGDFEVGEGIYVGFQSVSSGTYTLSGGSLSASHAYVGYSGTGSFTQTGGTNTIQYSLLLGHTSGSNGTYNLTGGLLTLAGIIEGPGTAAFNFSGGTLQAGASFSTSGPIALNASGGNATIDTAGYTLTASGPLSGSGNLVKAGSGTLILSGSNTYTGGTTVASGTLVLTNPSALATGSSLIVGSDDPFDYLCVGYNSGSNGSYCLSGGSLSVPYAYVGYSGTGTFTQSGGTNTISNALCLGYKPGSSGTYNLSGGMLILSELTEGPGAAVFNFSGGTLRAGASFSTSGSIMLGTSAGSATIDTAGYNVTLSGSLAGPGDLTKAGSGALILSGNNTYPGGTTVESGTLDLTDPSALASGSSLTVGEAGAFIRQWTTAASYPASTVSSAAEPAATLAAVPEPGTLVLLTAGAALLLLYRKRHC